jgi:hypothetical protein
VQGVNYKLESAILLHFGLETTTYLDSMSLRMLSYLLLRIS